MRSTAQILLGPRLIALHVVALIAVSAAGLLGWWQLQAWQSAREDRSLALASERPQPLGDVLGPDDPFPGADVGRPVVVAGRWSDAETLTISERRRTATGADDGVWQVALLEVCDAEAPCLSAVPVVLGWSPDATIDAGDPAWKAGARVTITGWLQPAEQGEPDPDPGDRTLPSLRTADLLTYTERDLYSGYVILDEPAALRGGLAAVTPESLPRPPPSTALRNLLYGLEWWVFAAFAVYLWLRWSRDAVAEAREQATERPIASGV